MRCERAVQKAFTGALRASGHRYAKRALCDYQSHASTVDDFPNKCDCVAGRHRSGGRGATARRTPTSNLTTWRERHAYFYPLTAQTLLPATGESALQEEENQKARKSNAAEENARPAPWRRSGGGKWRGRERLEGEGAGERGDAAHAD